ncbi:MAG: hypothetical protein ACI9FB_002372 [Candidatus Azotimanducaceae bacterium]|jgi:hypothetical protein
MYALTYENCRQIKVAIIQISTATDKNTRGESSYSMVSVTAFIPTARDTVITSLITR